MSMVQQKRQQNKIVLTHFALDGTKNKKNIDKNFICGVNIKTLVNLKNSK